MMQNEKRPKLRSFPQLGAFCVAVSQKGFLLKIS